MRRETIADDYLAGFVDGEGCFNITKYPNGGVKLSISLSNTNFEVLEKIKKQYGGNIKPIKGKGKRIKKTYCLRWAGKESVKLAKMLNGKLIVKAVQCEIFSGITIYDRGYEHPNCIEKEMREVAYQVVKICNNQYGKFIDVECQDSANEGKGEGRPLLSLQSDSGLQQNDGISA